MRVSRIPFMVSEPDSNCLFSVVERERQGEIPTAKTATNELEGEGTDFHFSALRVPRRLLPN